MQHESKVIAYARVSTDKQDADNQRFEIERYLKRSDLAYSEFVEETVSGKTQIHERKIGTLLQGLERGDTLIVSETSRISRRLVDVLNTIQLCIDRGVTVIAVKENYKFADNIESKVIAFAFGIAAEIERNLISQRTKEALAKKKAEGVVLGRPAGSYKVENLKLYGKDEQIISLLDNRVSIAAMARIFGVNRGTMTDYIDRRQLKRAVMLRRFEKSMEDQDGTGNERDRYRDVQDILQSR